MKVRKLSEKTEKAICYIFIAFFSFVIIVCGYLFASVDQLQSYVIAFAFGLCFNPSLVFLSEEIAKRVKKEKQK